MKKVLVYTSNTCPYCNALKEFLMERKVPFEEKNVSYDTQARDELMVRGVRSVPFTLVGDKTVLGFDKEKLSELLDDE